ncbi:ROK family transcriptional regulator [Streptomyces sp. NPDC087856]|uniref:ROK family transcriptional regulator n=1 Tax=Streptomyces sp. NPDC087856 TaxID=3365811 RepID=UPI003830B233
MNEVLSGGDLSRLRQLNGLAVIGVLRDGPALTLTELAKRTGLSRASTEDVVRELRERGWVVEAEPAVGTVGRPARRYRFEADAGRILGVDIGGHKILAQIADLSGTVLQSTRIVVSPTLGRAERLAAVDEAVAAVLRKENVEGSRIWATGVATTGLVDGTGRVMLSDALPEWTGVDVATHIRRLVAGPVLVENDCKVAALAETWTGVARYAKDVVFLFAGLRAGTGLIIDGKLHRGFGNAAGEIGALPAARWLHGQEHLRSWSKSAEDDVQDVFSAARSGDKKAATAVRRYVKDLAVGASALILTLDPELVVVGGGFSRASDLIVEPLRREIDRWCLRTPEIRVSSFGDEGVALGAIRLALNHIETTLQGGVELASTDKFHQRP